MKYYTYLFKDIDNTPIYVGKGCAKRWMHHRGASTHLGKLLRKRKKQGFLITPTITYHATEKVALAMEIFWIAVYGREDLGTGTLFNLTEGGEAPSFNSTTKKKMSESQKKRRYIENPAKYDNPKPYVASGKYKRTEEVLAKVRKSQQARDPATRIPPPVEDLTCPYCNKEGRGAVMYRHHFDRCKNRGNF